MRYQQTKLCWGPRGLRPAERLPAACKPPDNGGRSGPGRSAEPRGSPAHRHAGQRRTGEHRPPRSHGALRFREGTINPHPLPSARHRSPESPRSAAGPPSPREAPRCPALLPRPDPHRASASRATPRAETPARLQPASSPERRLPRSPHRPAAPSSPRPPHLELGLAGSASGPWNMVREREPRGAPPRPPGEQVAPAPSRGW